MDVIEAIETSSAGRYFEADPMPQDLIELVIYAATCISSPVNSREWEFIIVRNPETKRKIRDPRGRRSSRCARNADDRSVTSRMRRRRHAPGPQSVRFKLAPVSQFPLYGITRGYAVPGFFEHQTRNQTQFQSEQGKGRAVGRFCAVPQARPRDSASYFPGRGSHQSLGDSRALCRSPKAEWTSTSRIKSPPGGVIVEPAVLPRLLID